MPLYEYQCEVCGHRFEVIQKYSDTPIETCQRCNGAVRKLLSSPAIHFKGSGWYISDYARAGKSDTTDSGGAAAKTDSGASASGESKSESKTESTSEATTESKTEPKAEPPPPKPATS